LLADGCQRQDRLLEMIAENDFYFYRAGRNEETDAQIRQSVRYFLLSFPNVLQYAFRHEAGLRVVDLFVADQVALLIAQKNAMEQDNPDAVFDLDGAESCTNAWRILRYLIRRNRDDEQDQIRFMLNIPGVQALAHQGNNELLRFAVRLGNEQAASALLTVPAVSELAAQNNFYYQPNAELDLRRIADDPESSMRRLTDEEQLRMKRVKNHYIARIRAEGVEPLLDQLRATLRQRYEANPARLLLANGESIKLPCSWEDFNQLNLLPDDRVKAEQSYFANRDHGALRWLSKPNRWLASSRYCHGDVNSPGGAWSRFTDYKTPILLMWLAASDEHAPLTDDHTLEGRISHFIDELHLIERRHNWHNKRLNLHTRRQEHYDDMKRDRPSCFSGTLRGIFQSLIGHPLMSNLDLPLLEWAVHDLLLAHCQSLLDTDKRAALREIVTALEDLQPWTDEQQALLTSFDIPGEKQAAFKAALLEKYGDELRLSPKLMTWLDNIFLLDSHFSCHLMKLNKILTIPELLDVEVEEAGPACSSMGL